MKERKVREAASKGRRALIHDIARYTFAIVFVLAGWEITALLLKTPALPTPQATIPVFAQYAVAMWPDFRISLWRIVLSLTIGTVLGAPLGLALGRSPRVDAYFAPVLYILYPLPKIVLLPILLVLLGLGGAPKVALVTLTIFFQVLVVMRDAAKGIPEQTVLSVRSLGGSRLDVWRHVVIPSTLPELLTSLRVSSSVAIAVLFFAEAIAGSTGIGYFIMQSWSMVNYPRMFAGIIALAILGVIIYEIFDICERRISR
ncbi:MAG: ABC transporter permease subunit [Coriobacteriales bacterium]|nr:ABC transporter permease subunit [Coriobacteriales bacterium]MBQ6585679.1 ABC transporter permease subunit [Coriobacteriales bacterium]